MESSSGVESAPDPNSLGPPGGPRESCVHCILLAGRTEFPVHRLGLGGGPAFVFDSRCGGLTICRLVGAAPRLQSASSSSTLWSRVQVPPLHFGARESGLVRGRGTQTNYFRARVKRSQLDIPKKETHMQPSTLITEWEVELCDARDRSLPRFLLEVQRWMLENMGERDMQFGMAPMHHRDYHSPHHSRSRDGAERSSREFDSYLEKDRDRGRDRWRDREHEKERDRFKDKERGRDYDKERDRGREREPYVERNGHGHGGSLGRAGMVGGFSHQNEGRPGSRDQEIHGVRDDREERHGSAGATAGLEANTIYISNLPESVTEDSLAALLSETANIKMDRKTDMPMVKLFEDKMGGREAEVVLEDPRSGAGIVSWFNGYDFKGSKIQVSLGHAPPPVSRSSHERQGDLYGSHFDRDSHRSGYRGGRGRGRYPDRMPIPGPAPPGIRRGASMFGRGGFASPVGFNDFPTGGESFGRNNPNVTPREGDWICSEPTCGNLNFARRTHCNNCNKPRRDIGEIGIRVNGGFSQGGFGGPPHVPFMGGPVGGRELPRGFSGHGEPPGVWGRGRSSDFEHGSLPPISDRMSDFRSVRDMRDRDMYGGGREIFRDRERFHSRPPFERGLGPLDRIPLEPFVDRDRERGDPYREKRMLEGVDHRGRPASSPRSRWGREDKDRSSSPGRSLYRPDRHRDARREERRDRRDAPY